MSRTTIDWPQIESSLTPELETQTYRKIWNPRSRFTGCVPLMVIDLSHKLLANTDLSIPYRQKKNVMKYQVTRFIHEKNLNPLG